MHPDCQSAVLQVLVSGGRNGAVQEQYTDSMDSAIQQLGNRAFMHWVGALHAAVHGVQTRADTMQTRQDLAGGGTTLRLS